MTAHFRWFRLNWKQSVFALLVLAGLGLVLVPVQYEVRTCCSLISRDLSHLRGLVDGLRVYTTDYEGRFPHVHPDGTPFTTSTEAFQHLMEETGIATETIFYVQGNPEKPTRANGDGILLPQENCRSYVSNQTFSMFGNSPLIVQEMTGVGTFGEHHPFLKERKAVVGYVDGHVAIETLSSRKPGATIPGPRGSGIDNIFEPAEFDDEGNWTGGGYLAVPAENILHP